MSDEDYARGWQDGMAGRDPDPERLAYGANRMNDYEIGYLDSGLGDAPQRWPAGWAIPNVVVGGVSGSPEGHNESSEGHSDE